MTTHEALALRPNTPVHHETPRSKNAPPLQGVASPSHPQHIRVVWASIGESDSTISVLDRVMLSTIAIDDPTKHQDL